MNKTKIAIVTKNLEINGISSIILNYCSNINSENFEITIFAGNPINEKNIKKCKENNINVEKLSKKGLKFYYELFEKLKRGKYDVVHVHGSSSTIALEIIIAFLCKIKSRVAHSHNTTSEHPMAHYILKPFLNIFSTEKIACGEKAGIWMFGKNNFKIVNNGIEVDKFKFDKNLYNQMKKKYDLEDYFILGHIGRVNHQKNQKYLIDIIDKLAEENKKIALVMVGIGPDFEKIKKQVESSVNKNKIKLIGETEKPHEFYNMFDIFLLPSIYEGLPVVLIEAQANGLKCIVSNNVTNECNLTGNIKFLDLNLIDDWIKEIQQNYDTNLDNREDNSKKNSKILKDKGFDIKLNAKEIEKIYKK